VLCNACQIHYHYRSTAGQQQTNNSYSLKHFHIVNPMPLDHNIRAAGLKVTAQRTHILSLFQRHGKAQAAGVGEASTARHMGADEVQLALIKDGFDVGIATVYRVLTQFEQAGILRRSPFETSRAVYELNDGDHHDHIVCLDCGHVVEFVDPAIEARQEAVATQLGFQLQEHTMSMYGRCVQTACPRKASKFV
jgi:Fur family transcriptional regulator, ferric uptake regulator